MEHQVTKRAKPTIVPVVFTLIPNVNLSRLSNMDVVFTQSVYQTLVSCVNTHDWDFFAYNLLLFSDFFWVRHASFVLKCFLKLSKDWFSLAASLTACFCGSNNKERSSRNKLVPLIFSFNDVFCCHTHRWILILTRRFTITKH